MDIKYFISDLLENIKKRFRKTSSEENDWNTDYEASFYQQDYSNGKQDAPAGARPQNPADGELYIPDDEEDEGSRADRLRKKHILTAGGIVAFIAAASMAYTTLVPDTPDASKQQQPQETTVSARAGNKDLPSKYSDIAKYQNNQKPKEKESKGGNTAAKSNASTTESQPVTVRRSRAASSSSASSAPSVAAAHQPSISAEQKAALRAAAEAQKAEEEAMNSSIAFKVAAAVTNAVAGTATVQAAEPQPNENLFYDAEDETNGQYALQAGSVIPATLQTGVSSDMPGGDVVALVRQNIYDSLTGTHLLIPQGSKIIGTYGQAGARGNKRIGVIFERIILPDGSSLELPDQKAIDGTGTPGLIDKYTTHSSSLFKTAFMTALLGAAAQSATGNTSGDDNRSPGQEAVAGAVAEVMETASDLIDRDANIAPTITISPGYQFNIFINQDLLIGEYSE